MTIVRKEFRAKKTICDSCSEVIKRVAMKIDGVSDAGFSYATEKGHVTFDDEKTDINKIFKAIEEKGYPCSLVETHNSDPGKPAEGDEPDEAGVPAKNKQSRQNNLFGLGITAVGLVVIGYFLLPFIGGLEVPEFTSTMGYGLLFIAGLLTGFHCIGMCGSFVVSYTAKDAQNGIRRKSSHLLYGFGKTVSYTVIGGIFGLVGSFIAFTPLMRGVVALVAGIFLLVYGLRMLDVHPIFRRMTIRTPRFVSKFVKNEGKKHSNPLLIGLLNGLMIACGPLQAMYIMAAGTGSVVQGATLLFVFGIGTLPAMLGFGYFATFVSGRTTHRILKFSGIVVIALGFIMMNTGLALTGTGLDAGSVSASITGGAAASSAVIAATTPAASGYQEIRMDVAGAYTPDTFVLKKGVPVKWVINVRQLTGCNKGIQAPALGIKQSLKAGEQTIEFTPTQEGTIPFSCWMGMIQGRFIVKADVDTSNTQAVQQVIASTPKTAASSGGSCNMGSGGSCGGSCGGGCGCGG